MALYGSAPGQIAAPSKALDLSLSSPVPFWDPGSPAEAFESPSAWDTMWVGDFQLPGVARAQGARKIRVDERDAAGTDGQTLTFLGRDSSEILVKLRMWTEGQFSAWADLVPKIQPPPGRMPPSPFDVYFPPLSVNTVKSLYLVEVGLLTPTHVPQVMEVQLRFVEFLPAKKTAITTPLASKSTAKQGQGKPQKLAKPSEGEAAP